MGVARGQKRCDIIVEQATASINYRRSGAQRFEFGVRDWLVVAYRLDHVGARATVSPGVRRANDVMRLSRSRRVLATAAMADNWLVRRCWNHASIDVIPL